VKEYLSRQSVSFREVDVSRDAAAAADLLRRTGQQGVPVTVIDGETIVGYDRPRIDAALARAHRPQLGAAVADAAEMARQGRGAVGEGAYVGRVRAGSSAANAGLQVGDVIVAVAGRPIRTAADLEGIIPRLPPGQDVPLRVMRGAQTITLALRV
jgi:S1-C subfamily serine protease